MFRLRRHRPSRVTAVVAAAIVTAIFGYASPALAEDPDPGPLVTISGRVLDASGHGWPVLSQISGFPESLHNDPVTGRYEARVPANSSYYASVAADYAGYNIMSETIEVADTDVVHDFGLTIDTDACGAPGYRENVVGLSEKFSTLALPPSWQAPDDLGGGWAFTDPPEDNLTFGDGGLARATGYRPLNGSNTILTTPVVDLTGVASPVLRYNTDVVVNNDHYADVELSIDGAASWTSLQHYANSFNFGLTELPIPQAGGKSAVQVRFVYDGDVDGYWLLDNVVVGQRSCDVVPGGLVVGRTLDANTNEGLDGTAVASVEQPADRTSSYTMRDTCECKGFYFLFSTLTGAHPFAASRPGYVADTRPVDVVADVATWSTFTLGAGMLTVSPNPVSQTVAMGGQAQATVTVTNAGTVPVNATIGERSDAGQPRDLPWHDIASLPIPVTDNAAAAGNGKIYSIGGDGASGVKANVYDPWTDRWTAIADLPEPRQGLGAAFIDGKLYAVGGQVGAKPSVAIYDPAHNTWSYGADAPHARPYAGVAVLDGRIYVVGGCGDGSCHHTEVQVYDPAANTWTQVADYPLATAESACGGLLGRVYCAGGLDASFTDFNRGINKAYSYDPTTNTWSPIADLPIDLWAATYSATAGELLVTGGVSFGGHDLTSQGFAYRPGTNTWTEIAFHEALSSGGGACGFYRIGGSQRFQAVDRAQVLPGYDHCGSDAEVPWMSVTPTSLTLAPGASAELTVALDGGAVSQPGEHRAWLTFDTNTPYDALVVPVTLTVTPPAGWGGVTGVVVGAGCDGAVPLASALVQFSTATGHTTVLTDAEGGYTFWLDAATGPVNIIVAKDGWQPQSQQIDVIAGETRVIPWALDPVRPCQRP